MIRSDRRIRLCTTLLVCMLIVIWGNSLLPGSVSGAISEFAREVLAELLPADPLQADNNGGYFIRKLAHFSEFSVLGALLAWICGMLGKKFYWPLFLGVAAACADETIQRFVPDRGPSIKDVMLDTCGVAFGIFLLTIGHRYIVKRKQHGGNKQ